MGAVPTAAPELPANLTVGQGRFRRAQRIHAVAIAVIPALALLPTAWFAMTYGVSALDLALFAGMYVATILGIGMGYHRLFTHRSFKAIQPVRVALAICGSMAAQGSVVYWVSNHRRHHQYTDLPGDLHSPVIDGTDRLGRWAGFWHSHMGWTFGHALTNPLLFAKDLYHDPAISRINRLYLVWVGLGLALPAALGGLLTGTWTGAVGGLLWGGFVRLFVSYHVSNGIDSVTHMFGTQPFETRDESRNNPLWVLPTLGEGWHNNHHAFPTSASFGLRWWQVDPAWWLIRGLERVGWAWDVKRVSPEMVAEKSRPAPVGA
jgi:stearoyl-CoA desaturase (delta-9 desaturase)